METQERVFRMVEQLARRGVDRAEVVTALVAADRAVAVSTETPTIAWVGYRAVRQLVALADEAVLICPDPKPINLSAFGFEPIVFDARDPAAFAWVMFELSARADAEREAQRERCRCRPTAVPTAIGLARL